MEFKSNNKTNKNILWIILRKCCEQETEVYHEDGVYILKEEDRLSCAVRRISQEAFIVPRGAFVKKTNGYVIPNDMFMGIGTDEIKEKMNFFHFRIPLNNWEENLQFRDDYNYAVDFMDPINKDIPQGSMPTLY